MLVWLECEVAGEGVRRWRGWRTDRLGDLLGKLVKISNESKPIATYSGTCYNITVSIQLFTHNQTLHGKKQRHFLSNTYIRSQLGNQAGPLHTVEPLQQFLCEWFLKSITLTVGVQLPLYKMAPDVTSIHVIVCLAVSQVVRCIFSE